MSENYIAYHNRFVFGFHGCDEEVCKKILNSQNENLNASNNPYDWLGNGIYFWLNDPLRALEWAEASSKVKKPAVLGAIIDLGACLNLNERDGVNILETYYERLKKDCEINGYELKRNKSPDEGGYPLLRYLDCAVITEIHKDFDNNKELRFDTVVGTFLEGKAAYPNAGFNNKTHTQVCVRNANCILGYFLPRIN